MVAVVAIMTLPVSVPAQQPDSVEIVARAARVLCDKRVVVLGEPPSHGESRTFQAKAGIVEWLVDRCGFAAVLLEAPIYDFVGFQAAAASGRALPQDLDKAIGRFWWTRELTDWRKWLFERASSGKLLLGGLDDQVSVTSDYARASLPSLIAASSSVAGASECEQTVARNLYWRYTNDQPFDEPEQARLQSCTRSAATTRSAADGKSATSQAVMLENLASYVDRQAGVREARERDEAMYRNVRWYGDRLPAGSKVVIWTATVHAARLQGELPRQPLGVRLAAQYGRQLAVVGFTALGGQMAMAGHPIQPLAQLPSGSLEALALRRNFTWAVLNGSALRAAGRVPSRLLGPISTADWADFFDYVVVVKEEVAPVFEQWR